jgi:hypothetical protein
LWWAALVVPLWAVLILCTHWEPVMRDGWGHIGWYRQHSPGLTAYYEFCKEIYLNENPRLGQFLTLVVHARGPVHAIVTPVVELGVFAMLTVLALGRVPSVRRSDDAFVGLIVTALILACVPQIGPMLFYRPFTGNYTFGLALNLLWLVPYRLALAPAPPARIWLAPVMLVLGLVAGLCNEHTGLAVIGLGSAATLVAALRRSPPVDRTGRPASSGRLGLVWMIAGLVGLATGYAVLLTAPGQHVRYGGLADHAGIVQRVLDRGAVGNLAVIGRLALALGPMLALAAIAVIERRRLGRAEQSRLARWTQLALAVAGLACTLTLYASPKIGPRLYFASVALISAGFAGWLAAQVRSRWARIVCAALAAIVVLYVELRLVAIHRVIGPLGELRRDRIEHAARGAAVAVPRYPYGTSRYFLGDDFTVATLRQALAGDYGLAALDLEPDAR